MNSSSRFLLAGFHPLDGKIHYTHAILHTVASVRDTPGDTDEAVAARMERQCVRYTGGRRFAFLMELSLPSGRQVVHPAET
ncbi:hypothetical protein San01_37520 [Streptomyces angustmyceticus]|uniref:Uncharacterized protein n=1 Tax=Streptomyces angustmyceticus TaxID=285578 RepID=A0A5J4LLU2_9ACTN|nr:hypothetical protein San01_37520 [Streptomyces angustmyceticus]